MNNIPPKSTLTEIVGSTIALAGIFGASLLIYNFGDLVFHPPKKDAKPAYVLPSKTKEPVNPDNFVKPSVYVM